MMFGLTKGGKLLNVIMHKVIWANQKAKSFVCLWLCAHAVFNITRFLALVGASDIVSGILSIHYSNNGDSHLLNGLCPAFLHLEDTGQISDLRLEGQEPAPDVSTSMHTNTSC